MSDLVLIDTSAWIEFSRHSPGVSAVGDEVRKLIEVDRATITEIIFVEVAQGARSEREMRRWSQVFSVLTVARTDEDIWLEAAGHAYKLGRQGLNVPVADTLIAAVAIKYDIALLHKDRHFTDMSGILRLRLHAFSPRSP